MWVAGAVAGKVGLDSAPAVQGLDKLISKAVETKSVVEKDLGTLKVAVDTKGATEAIRNLQAEAAKVAEQAKKNFDSLSFPERMQFHKDFKAAQAGPAAASAGAGAAEAAEAVKKGTEAVGKAGEEAAAKAGEEAGGSWLAGFAKRMRADDRKTGELVLGSFLGRGLGGAADLGMSALGLGVTGIVIDFAAKGLDQIIGGVREMNEAIKKGEANWADVTMGIGKTLPVLSSVFSLGENINESITGQRKEIERAAEEQRLWAEQAQAQQSYAEHLRGVLRDYKVSISAAKVEAAAMRAELEGALLAAAQMRAEAEKKAREEEENERFKENRKALAEKKGATLAPVNKELANVRRFEADAKDEGFWSTASFLFNDFLLKNQSTKQMIQEAEDEVRRVKDRSRQVNASFRTEETKLETAHQDNLVSIKAVGAVKAEKVVADSAAAQLQKEMEFQLKTASMADNFRAIEKVALDPSVTEEQVRSMKRLADAINDVAKAREKAADAAERERTKRDMQREGAARNLDTIEGLKRELAQIGMSEKDKRLSDIARDPKTTADTVLKSIDLLNQIEAKQKEAEAARAGDERVKAIAEAMTPPTEKFQKSVDELVGLKLAGKLDERQFEFGAAQASKEAFGESRLPKLIMAGTAEAFAARFDGKQAEDPAVTVAKQQLATEEAIEDWMAKLYQEVYGAADETTNLAGVQ
jgi:hypothetical protein